MTQSQYKFPDRQCERAEASSRPYQHRSHLLQQHPVLTPVFLLAGAVGLFIVSFSADRLLPALAMIGIPTTSLCLIAALVLGIAGILVSIIHLIERVDRQLSQRLQAAVFTQSKEHSYANRH